MNWRLQFIILILVLRRRKSRGHFWSHRCEIFLAFSGFSNGYSRLIPPSMTFHVSIKCFVPAFGLFPVLSKILWRLAFSIKVFTMFLCFLYLFLFFFQLIFCPLMKQMISFSDFVLQFVINPVVLLFFYCCFFFRCEFVYTRHDSFCCFLKVTFL